jgi:hypothetical protein
MRRHKHVRGTMDISDMNSQRTYETLPEQVARMKQSIPCGVSIESHSFISKINSVADNNSYLFSYDSEVEHA